ncbi:MAG: glycosyltransferase family 39 protein [Acidimicrobiales bacterium]
MAQRQVYARGSVVLRAPQGGIGVMRRPSVRYVPRHAIRRQRDRARMGAAAVVAAATAANGGLALYHLGNRSLWLDEGYTWLISRERIHQIWAQSAGDGGHLFFYLVAVHLITALLGAGPSALRLFSVAAGVPAVPLMYLLARRIGGGRPTGLIATVLFAVSAPFVFWEQNARDYSVLVLLAVATMLALVLAVQTRRTSALVAWGILTALACYTHLEEGLLAAAELLPLLAWPAGRALGRRLAVVLAVLGAGLVPALAAYARHPHAQAAFLTRPTATIVKEVAVFLASGTVSGLNIGLGGPALLLVTAGLWMVALVRLAGDVGRWGLRPSLFGRAMALSCLVVPFGLSWIMSETFDPVFLDRYLVVSLPAASIVAALALARLRPRAVAIHGLLYLCVFRLGVLMPFYSQSLTDFAGATDIVAAHSRRGDCIVFDEQATVMIYDYYSVRPPASDRGHVLPVQVLPSAPSGAVPSVVRYVSQIAAQYYRTPAMVAAAVIHCPRLWLYESDLGQPAGTSVQKAKYARFVALRRELTSAYGTTTNYATYRVELQLFSHRR